MLSVKKDIFSQVFVIIMSVYRQSTNDLMSVYNTEASLTEGQSSINPVNVTLLEEFMCISQFCFTSNT